VKWYKHDPNAALAGMIGLTVEERGAYYTLIDLLYARAPHNDVTDQLVIKALGCRPQVWRRLKGGLTAKGKVHETDGKLSANRVETEVKLAVNRIDNMRVLRARQLEKQALSSGGAERRPRPEIHNQIKKEEMSPSDSPPKINPEKKARAVYPQEFETFYDAYPLKVGKGAAHKAWLKATHVTPNEELIAGAQRYAADPNRDPSYTKHPATWLNAGCHNDCALPPRFNFNGGGNGQGRPAPKDDPKSIRGAFDRLSESLGPDWEDEARELSRQARFRIIPGGSGE